MSRLTGIASRTEVSYPVGSFEETIARGAFKGVDKADVVLLAEHGGLPLARTSNGTLHLKETHEGLAVDADLDDDDELSRAVMSRVKSGLYTHMSFAFRAAEQRWDHDAPVPQRRILLADLDGGDVSVVGHAASKATSVAARGGTLTLEERRALATAVGAQVITNVRGLYLAEDAEERSSDAYSTKDLVRMAKAGLAIPIRNGAGKIVSGSWPIADRHDLDAALTLFKSGHGNDPAGVIKAHIQARAKALGVPDPFATRAKRALEIVRLHADRQRQQMSLRAFATDEPRAKFALGAMKKCPFCKGGTVVVAGKSRRCRTCRGSGFVNDRVAQAAAANNKVGPAAAGKANGESDNPSMGSTSR